MIDIEKDTKQIKSTTQRYFLVLTKLPGFQDTTQPYFYLGEWCLSSEEKLSRHGQPLLTHPRLDKINSLHSYQYAMKIYASLLPQLANWLNETHKTNYSLQYWRIVIGPFLMQYIQIIYHRASLLKKAHAKYKNLNTIGLSNTSYLCPKNTADFEYLAGHSDAWNHQLFSQLWHLLFAPITRNQEYDWAKESTYRTTTAQITPYKIKTKALIKIISFLIKITKGKIIGLCYTDIIFSNKWRLLKTLFLAKFRALPLLEAQLNQTNSQKQTINKKTRESLTTLTCQNKFSTIILETLKTNLPLNFLENYQHEDTNSQICFPYRPNHILGFGWVQNDRMKFWAAKCAEKGSKLIAMQHGGCYGQFRFSAYEAMERDSTDAFISWGWIDDQKKVIPAPVILVSTLIAEVKKNKAAKRDLILWPATEPASRYLTFFAAFPITTAMQSYLDWQERFLSTLNNNIFDTLTLRPNPTRQWHQPIQSCWPALKIDQLENKESFFDRLKQTKILVVDNLATTFLYGLALNIPTLLFWEKWAWPIRKDAKPYFALLEKVKIYHRSPESAAAFLNQIAADPNTWWHSDAVQAAREEFCCQYIQTTKSPLRTWAKILNDIRAM